MEKQLQKLQCIIEMALNVEESKLRIISLEKTAKNDEINRLDELSIDRTRSLNEKGGTDHALFCGVDINWRKWQQLEKTVLNTQLAALRAEHEIQWQITKKAFGKNEVAIRLLEKATAKRAKKQCL